MIMISSSLLSCVNGADTNIRLHVDNPPNDRMYSVMLLYPNGDVEEHDVLAGSEKILKLKYEGKPSMWLSVKIQNGESIIHDKVHKIKGGDLCIFICELEEN